MTSSMGFRGMDESQLVSNASQGDRGAVEQLLARHVTGLRAFLHRNAGSWILQQESATDLVQSVCREALQHVADARFDYRGEAAFKQWLYQAALLKVKDRRKYYGAEKRRPPSGGPAQDSRSPGLEEFFRSSASPSRAATVREQVDAMAAAFAELEPAQREIIELARIHGRSHREIAEQLGISEAHSRMRLSRALARLATLARDRFGEDPVG